MNTIDARELNAIMEEDGDWILIDTLPEESYEQRHIPGAHSVPANEPDFVERVDELVESRDDTVIVYCSDESCGLSPEAAEKLEEAGFTNVLDFSGGLKEWKEAGNPLASESGARAT